jgi:hypothetical protein
MIPTHNTLEAENVALQPKAPWIMEEGQVEGHESQWKEANRKSYSYLLYKATSINGKPAPPPQRQPFAGPPAAILAATAGCVESLKAVTGIRFDATMSERLKDESGKAIRELKNNDNLGAYHYIDNYGRALHNTGLVLIDLIPYTYDTKRIVAVVGDDGKDDRVQIDPMMPVSYGQANQGPNLPAMKKFNPKVGRYEVTVTIGPNYATKRIEETESMMDFARAMPQVGQLVADLIAAKADWAGSEEIATRLAKALDPKLLTPDKADIPPQVQALIQAQGQQLQQLQQVIQAMQKELADRQADRQVVLHQVDTNFTAKMEKTSKDFEAKVLSLGAKMEEVQAKRDATLQGTIGRQLAEIAKSIAEFGKMQQQQKQGTERTGA